MMINKLLKACLVALYLLITSSYLYADTAVTLLHSYAGKINFVGAEATRRTQSNNGNACAILGVNNNNTAVISGIPTGATITAAHLYWAGSGSNPDYTVNFEGRNITADANRQYTADYSNTYFFFSGVAEVTDQVVTKRNGSYNFSGLSVDNGNPYCGVEGVLAGWSLVVIYEEQNEDFRVLNLYEGFETFRNSSITLTPSNFRVPANVNGKYATLTWEGDDSINANGENLVFNGTPLVDGDNLEGEQFNSNSNIASIAPSTGGVNSNSYGVDFDSFPINNLINPGATSATSVYSSGNDLVILSAQILSITNTAVSDLGINKTASSSFISGSNATYNLAVDNTGPNIEPGPITVTDSLPAGLTFVSAIGTDWTCNSVAPLVTCTRTDSLGIGLNAPPITLTVAVSGSATTITNTASVYGTNFDNQNANDNDIETTSIISGPNISLQKTVTTVYDPVNQVTNPKAIPGSVLEYTITGTNSGNGPADPNSITISDVIPPNTQLCVNATTVDGFNFCIEPYLVPNSSTLGLGSVTYFDAADVAIPALPADADGTNSGIARMAAALTNSFDASTSFSLVFRVVVQ